MRLMTSRALDISPKQGRDHTTRHPHFVETICADLLGGSNYPPHRICVENGATF